MNKKELWQIFMKTGKVSDYLNYKNARDDMGFPVYEDEEFSEEFSEDFSPEYNDGKDTDYSDIIDDMNY